MAAILLKDHALHRHMPLLEIVVRLEQRFSSYAKDWQK